MTAFEPKTLDISRVTTRDYQDAFFAAAMQRFDSGEPGRWLFAAPTGSGKSIMELMLLPWLQDFVLVTPRLEIVAGMLQKGGVDTADWSDERLAREALNYRITTPIRLRNLLAKGEFPFRIAGLILDECHRSAADSWQDIEAYTGPVPVVGLTATPFRGTPKGTAEFLDQWDEVNWVIDYPQAAERGVISVPQCEVWPLVDDDQVDVVNGEFRVASLEAGTVNVLDDVVARCGAFRRDVFGAPNERGEDVPCGSRWDRPTMFAVPTREIAHELALRLCGAGLPANAVTQHTPRAERNEVFADCERAKTAIVQIDVVSEGVDLKIRRLIDLRPTLSPVKFLQTVGRITRPVKPGEPPPEYYCTNRNLERHGYLYEGCLPTATIRDAQQAFGTPSSRTGARVVGLSELSRFKAAELPLADGTTGLAYQLTIVEGFTKTEYAVIVHPASLYPLYARRQNAKNPDGTLSYGKWSRCDPITDVSGFQSAPAKSITDKQRAFWERCAARVGLDPAAEPNRRNFCVLPVLLDIGARIGGRS